MSVIRLESFRLLQATIEAAVPGIDVMFLTKRAGKPCVPGIEISRAGRFRYEPFQESIVFEPDSSHAVLNVGCHEGMVQIRLTAASETSLYELEQKLLDLFLGTEGHPGVLLTTVTACPALGDVLASWELEDDEWEDAKAFDNRFESTLAVNASIPALVTRAGVYREEQLQVGLTADMEKPYTPATFDTSPEVDLVQVNSDGTISPVS